MERWAAALGASAAPAPPHEVPARRRPAAVGDEGDEARRPPIGESYPVGGVAAAVEEARPQDGLIRPGLDGALHSYGFAAAEDARERGRRAAAEKADRARGRARAVDPSPERHREARR